ncbi:hypothetical protein Taro_032887 [Colocasia esculenta]|uniref:Uncharacterized protein n=1 Tax=Colocasia esculenta TaxID=4460 RepID=A0A843VMG2_COLES|nr:hypothetical protein [Colocasia esculenta]
MLVAMPNVALSSPVGHQGLLWEKIAEILVAILKAGRGVPPAAEVEVLRGELGGLFAWGVGRWFHSQTLLVRCYNLLSGYVLVDEKLPRYVVPDLTDFKLQMSTPKVFNL